MANELKGYAALKSRQIWTWPFALFSVVNYAIAFTIVDVVPLPAAQMPWAILSEVICIAIMLVLGVIVRQVVLLALEERTRGIWLNVSLFILVVFLTNAIGSPILHWHQSFEWSNWFKDVGIGIFGGLYIGVMYVSLFGIRHLQRQTQQNLEITSSNLNAAIATTSSQITEHQESLYQRTKKVLVPLIDEIKGLLSSSTDAERILEKFKNVVYNDVATLVAEAKNIEKQSHELQQTAAASPIPKPRLSIDLNRDLKPLSIWLTYLPGLVLVMNTTTPMPVMLLGFLTSYIFFGLLALIKFSFKSQPSMSMGNAVLLIISASLVHTGIAAILASFWIEADGRAVVISASLYGSLVLALSYTLVNASNRSQATALAELAKVNKGLEAANDRLNRSLWVASMRWHSLLHGTVQSTLTRCILSLGPKQKITKADRDTLLELLDNISDALEAKPNFDFDFDKSMSEIVETWAGVCKVTVKVETPAKKSIKQDDTLAYVLNELIKEQVSNLYSQLKPEQIKFTMGLNSLGELSLSSTAKNYSNGEFELPKEQFNKLNFIAPRWQYLVEGKTVEIIATLSVA